MTGAAAAQPALSPTASNVFEDGPKGEKIHVASGFVCPDKIGRYIRDAVGEGDLDTGSDFCSYYALDGVYGTVTLTPLRGPYNPEASLSSVFIQQEGIGARKVDQKTLELGPKGTALKVYTRTYETARLETLHYRILFAGAPYKGWIVEATAEYAEPRDDQVKNDFLDWVYGPGLAAITGTAQAQK